MTKIGTPLTLSKGEDWIVHPNGETGYACRVCVALRGTDGGVMQVDIDCPQAIAMAAFLVKGPPSAPPFSYAACSRNAPYLMAEWISCAEVQFSCSTLYYRSHISAVCAKLLGDRMAVVASARRNPAPKDPLDGPRHRTDDNLQGVFG